MRHHNTFSPIVCGLKEIEIIHRLFLVIAMYCQASSSQFNESLNFSRCQLAGKEAQVHAVCKQQFTRNNLCIISISLHHIRVKSSLQEYSYFCTHAFFQMVCYNLTIFQYEFFINTYSCRKNLNQLCTMHYCTMEPKNHVRFLDIIFYIVNFS